MYRVDCQTTNHFQNDSAERESTTRAIGLGVACHALAGLGVIAGPKPGQDRHQQRSATAVPSISATGLGVIARSELGNGGGIRHEPDGLPVQSRRRPSDGSRRRRDQRRRQWRRPSFLDHQRHVHLMFMIDWHGSHCSSTWASQAWGRQGTRPGPSTTLSGLRHHRGDRRLSASGVSYNDTSELSFSDWLSPDQPAD